jgi:hypothetical protein
VIRVKKKPKRKYAKRLREKFKRKITKTLREIEEIF